MKNQVQTRKQVETYHKNMSDVFAAPSRNAAKNIERHERYVASLKKEEPEESKEVKEELDTE